MSEFPDKAPARDLGDPADGRQVWEGYNRGLPIRWPALLRGDRLFVTVDCDVVGLVAAA